VTFAGGVSVAEYPATGVTPGVRYVRGLDIGGGVGGNLYSLRGGTALYSQYNSRGDVIARTDATGTATYAAAYEAFGQAVSTTGSNPDRFAANSKEKDPTGLLNEGFRYRDLDTGAFLTRDPLGFVDGPNLYAYVMQNPWSKFDPEGLSALDTVKDWGRSAQGFAGGALVGVIEGTLGINHPAESYGSEYNGRELGRKAVLATGIVTTGKGLADMTMGGAAVAAGGGITLGTGGVGGIVGAPAALTGAAQVGVGAIETTIGGVIVLNSLKLRPIPGGESAQDAAMPDGDSAKDAAKSEGIYEFPDQKAGGKPYVGQSGDLDKRLGQHEKSGRLQHGTETTTDVAGGKTSREVAEHNRIQEITGGVPAAKTDAVSNKVDPIGPNRQHLLDPNKK
jgi:RHS repeat-associated protein